MKKAVFIILDGFGIAPPTAGNAIAQAMNTPDISAELEEGLAKLQKENTDD